MRAVTAVALTLCVAHQAWAALWLGPVSRTGPVELPAQYVQFMAGLAVQRTDFDVLTPGSDQTGRDLGGFLMTGGSPETLIVAQTGPVAGAEPVSSPIALLVAGMSSDPVSVRLELVEPARAVGLALLGLGSPARVKVYDPDLRLVANHTIPAMAPGYRRWVGLAETTCDIRKIVLEPQGGGDYGIDDLELGVDLPEPTCLTGLIGTLLIGARRCR